MDQNKQNTFFTILAILAGALIIAAAIYYKDSNPTLTKTSSTQQAKEAKIESVGKFVLGNPNADLVMIEFADFQCPFCGKFYKTAEQQIIEKYIKTGKLRFEYRDLAFLGEESILAAEAARCANDQGKFWQYHNYLYEHQGGENQGAFSKANLKKFAQDLGLDTNQFNQCLDSEKYRNEVERSNQEAKNLGANSTPTILIGRLPMIVKKNSSGISEVINGEFILGAYPFETFDEAIKSLLR